MRINVYAEEYELNRYRRFEVVHAETEGGDFLWGIRLFLEGSSRLHGTEEDDDRSAITFWGDPKKISQLLQDAARKFLEQAA